MPNLDGMKCRSFFMLWIFNSVPSMCSLALCQVVEYKGTKCILYTMDDKLTIVFNSFSSSQELSIWTSQSQNTLILLYHVCRMYKVNSNFCAGCSNWAIWVDLRFVFVHSTEILYRVKKDFFLCVFVRFKCIIELNWKKELKKKF